MWKAMVSLAFIAGTTAPAGAQTITDPDEIAARLRFWDQDAGSPVYYGEVRNVDKRTRRVAGHYQCLALAFIKYENGVFQYAHKMWPKSRDGSCHYEDVTARKVGNRGACVKDSSAPGRSAATTRLSKDTIDYQRSIFRTVDTNTRRVGETAACVKPRGASAGLLSVAIANGRFRVITSRPLAYEVSIEAQDPNNPPTVPVF